jgi:Endosomal/lysosomal potassium channel TMEM175
MPGGDERTTHRLEAFSDIVIGFCMAELGLSLVIPKDAAGLASSWANLNVFAVSFVLIALIWWWHHKFFLATLQHLDSNPPKVNGNRRIASAQVIAHSASRRLSKRCVWSAKFWTSAYMGGMQQTWRFGSTTSLPIGLHWGIWMQRVRPPARDCVGRGKCRVQHVAVALQHLVLLGALHGHAHTAAPLAGFVNGNTRNSGISVNLPRSGAMRSSWPCCTSI